MNWLFSILDLRRRLSRTLVLTCLICSVPLLQRGSWRVEGDGKRCKLLLFGMRREGLREGVLIASGVI